MKLLRHEKDPKMPKGSAKLPEETVKQIIAWIDAGAPYDKPLIEKADPKAWISQQVRPGLEKALGVSAAQARRSAGGAGRQPGAARRSTASSGEAGSRRAIAPNGPGRAPETDSPRVLRPDRPAADAGGGRRVPEGRRRRTRTRRWSTGCSQSPHYGERWARHWLDLARFAESHGFEHDYDRPTAYHYRDFVIKALNDDLPYDTFVKWQTRRRRVRPGRTRWR